MTKDKTLAEELRGCCQDAMSLVGEPCGECYMCDGAEAIDALLAALLLVPDYERQKNEYMNRSHSMGPEWVRKEANRVSKLYDAMQAAAESAISKALAIQPIPERGSR